MRILRNMASPEANCSTALAPRVKAIAVAVMCIAMAIPLSSCSLLSGNPVEKRVVEVTPSKQGPYRIGRDDVLNVVVWKQPQLTGQVTVAEDGTITVPLAGRVKAAGLTTQELQEHLTKKLAADINDPTVTVSVASPNSMVFYILGQVRAPGVYPLRSGEVLSQALAQAGGLTPFANARAIRIVRRTSHKDVDMTVNYEQIENNSSPQDEVTIKAGDTITVP